MLEAMFFRARTKPFGKSEPESRLSRIKKQVGESLSRRLTQAIEQRTGKKDLTLGREQPNKRPLNMTRSGYWGSFFESF